MQVNQYHEENGPSTSKAGDSLTKLHNGNFCSNLFYELEIKENRLQILKRYSNIKVIGAGAQGLVLYIFN